MKKLLLAFVVMASVGYDASAMIFNKDRTVALPVVHERCHAIWSRKDSQAWLEQLEGLEGDARKQKIKMLCDEFKKDSKNVRTSPMMNYERCTKFYQGRPYKKQSKSSSSILQFAQELDDYNFNETVESLETTRNILKTQLSQMSWSEWLWNYRAYNNYQKSIQMLDGEIALCKDQDRIVYSPANLKQYFNCKNNLTYRDVFTRSSMPRIMFEQVKAARE